MYKTNRLKRKIIKVKDGISYRNNGFFHGEVIFGTGRHEIEYINPYGEKAIRTEFEKTTYIGKNTVPIGGYQFVFDKLFNIAHDQDSTLRVGNLNDEAPMMRIGVPRDKYKSIYYDTELSLNNGSVTPNSGIRISALDKIFGFMIGDGGAKEDNITAIAPNYKNRNLYRPIPFRMNNDGNEIVNGKYFGKLTSIQGSTGLDPITSYYIKKFDNPQPRIVHIWVTGNPKESSLVDDTVFSSTSSIPIESYIEINFSVDEYDIRGFSTSIDSTPKVNEFGLVSGWYNAEENDYECITLITHFTRPNIVLSEGDSIEGIYRLYAR